MGGRILPLISQRTELGSDGQPPENGNDDCVPASLNMAARGFGVTTFADGTPLTADGLHDRVYGQGSVGFEDAAQYVSLFATLGLKLYPLAGSAANLIAQARQLIDGGRVVLFTIPSDWGNEPPRSLTTHVMAGCQTTAGEIGAADPWYVRMQWGSDAWWTERQRGPIWIVERIAMAGIPAGWHDDGTTLTAPNGGTVAGGFREHIMQEDWNPGLEPVSGEYDDATGNLTVQEFIYPRRLLTTKGQPGVWEDSGIDYAAVLRGLRDQLATAEQQIASLQAEAAHAAMPGSVEAIAAVRAMQAAIKALGL